MTPGSAGGELGDYRALRWEKPSQASKFNVVAQFAHPATSHLPLSLQWEELEEHGSAPFTVALHSTRKLPSMLSYRGGEGHCVSEPKVVIVEAMFTWIMLSGR